MKPRNRTPLDIWMYGKMFSDQAFADALTAELKGATVSPETVRKWRLGTTVPRPARIRAITAVTKGEITANSFVQVEP